MDITVTSNGSVTPSMIAIGYQNENNVRTLDITIPKTVNEDIDLANLNIRIEADLAAKYYTAAISKTLVDTNYTLTQSITDTFTANSGYFNAQIVAYNQDNQAIWKSNNFTLYVAQSVNADSPIPEHVNHTFDEVQALADEAAASASTAEAAANTILNTTSDNIAEGTTNLFYTPERAALKVDVVADKGLSENDYTDADKSRLANTSGTNTGDQNATGVLITDAGGYFTGANTEAALQEIGAFNSAYKTVAGVIRNDGTGWAQITTGEHVPINIDSVTYDTSIIYVNHAIGAEKVVSLVCTPDETMAGKGFFCGASVGVDQSRIELFRTINLSAYIAYNGSAWVVSYGSGVASVTFSNGILTITHDSVSANSPVGLLRVPIAQVNCRNASYLVGVGTAGDTTTQIYIRDYAGNLVTTPTTDMRFYFNRSAVCQVNPTNFVSEGGNIWIYGVFKMPVAV